MGEDNIGEICHEGFMRKRVMLNILLILACLGWPLDDSQAFQTVLSSRGDKLGKLVQKTPYITTFYSESIGLDVSIYNSLGNPENGYVVDIPLFYDGDMCTGVAYIDGGSVPADTLVWGDIEIYRVGKSRNPYFYYLSTDAPAAPAIVSQMNPGPSCHGASEGPIVYVGPLYAARTRDQMLPFFDPVPFPLRFAPTSLPYPLLLK